MVRDRAIGPMRHSGRDHPSRPAGAAGPAWRAKPLEGFCQGFSKTLGARRDPVRLVSNARKKRRRAPVRARRVRGTPTARRQARGTVVAPVHGGFVARQPQCCAGFGVAKIQQPGVFKRQRQDHPRRVSGAVAAVDGHRPSFARRRCVKCPLAVVVEPPLGLAGGLWRFALPVGKENAPEAARKFHRSRDQPSSCAASQCSASSAAMQPMPALVTAWRNLSSVRSPAAKTPGTEVAVLSGAVTT